jgi:2-phosphoglycerate kinase
MIYLIGGSPRSGKSILGQRVSAHLRIGWISTDILFEILRVKQVEGVKREWDASPEAITNTAEWFFPCLERFVWRISVMAESYVIEGVDFLPAQVVQLAAQYQIRSVFLGCAKMTPERFDKFPGHTGGYAMLPEEVRHQFARDVPQWSKFIQQEAERFDTPYIDMSDDFPARLSEAEELLTA